MSWMIVMIGVLLLLSNAFFCWRWLHLRIVIQNTDDILEELYEEQHRDQNWLRELESEPDSSDEDESYGGPYVESAC